MDASTTAKLTRVEQCRVNAQKRSEQKRQAALSALTQLKLERRTITKAAVARRAGVSLVFLRSHADLVQAIEEATRARPASVPAPSADTAKDQVIAALRRRLDEMKQQLATKDQELRNKQREIDRLYGKLAAASPLTDAELRRTLACALERLAQDEMDTAEERAMRRTP
jgi:chromosome segregation ATPase